MSIKSKRCLVLSCIVVGIVLVSYGIFLFFTSPYPVLLKINKSLLNGNLNSFMEYCDVRACAKSIAYETSDLVFLSEKIEMHDYFNKTNDDALNLYIEKCISDIVEYGDCMLSEDSSNNSLKQLCQNKDLYFENRIPVFVSKLTKNEAIVKLPIYQLLSNEVIASLDLVFLKDDTRWKLCKIKNCRELMDFLTMDKPTNQTGYSSIVLKDIINEKDLYLLYIDDILNKYSKFTSYSFRYTTISIQNDSKVSTVYTLYERNSQNDVHYKFVQDDEKGFTNEQRDIYFLDGTIYYHGSPGTGWIRVDENSATIEMIQPPQRVLNNLVGRIEPWIIKEIDHIGECKLVSYADYINLIETVNLVHLRWKEKTDMEALLFVSNDEILVAGIVSERRSNQSELVQIFQISSVNKPISFSIDTKVER